MNDEEYVKSKWGVDPVVQQGDEYGFLNLWKVQMVSPFSFESREKAYTAAAEYTRNRERLITDKTEEVDSTRSDVKWFAQGGSYEDQRQRVIHDRILAMLEAQLRELQRGMK